MLPIDCPSCTSPGTKPGPDAWDWRYVRGDGYRCGLCGYFVGEYQIIVMFRGNPNGPPEQPPTGWVVNTLDMMRSLPAISGSSPGIIP